MMYPNPAVNLVPTAVKVEDFPYLTEEYFVSGTAAGAPYQTRIVVRRPKDPKAFSGTVVAEAQHAGGRSLIFEWSRVSILTRHHLFVEIVHGANNVATMKMFNAERYAPLNIAMGQANEIIAQVGRLVKARVGPFAPYDVKRITLMGTSASSATVRTYLAAHPELRMPDGKPIYDGFLLTSTLGNTPLPIVDVPIVQMPNADRGCHLRAAGHRAIGGPTATRRRTDTGLYEVAGMPHNNARDRPEFQTDPCTLPVTDFHCRRVHRARVASSDRVESPTGRCHRMHRRSPWTRTPMATIHRSRSTSTGMRRAAFATSGSTCRSRQYGVFGKGKMPAQDRLCQLAGTEVPLSDATVKSLYRDKSDYERKVARRLDELVKEGWFLPEYVDAITADVRHGYGGHASQ
jgi:hypothetical protein